MQILYVGKHNILKEKLLFLFDFLRTFKFIMQTNTFTIM